MHEKTHSTQQTSATGQLIIMKNRITVVLHILQLITVKTILGTSNIAISAEHFWTNKPVNRHPAEVLPYQKQSTLYSRGQSEPEMSGPL